MHMTGYFGNPVTQRSTKVHIIADGIPICGTRISKDYEFEWCAHDIQAEYIDCEKCKRLGVKILMDQASNRVKKFNLR